MSCKFLEVSAFTLNTSCEEDMFMASLICNMDVDCEKLLVCKMDLLCVKTLQFNTEVNHNSGRCFSCPQELTLDGCGIDASATYFMGKSPFPALDTFIESVASIGNVSGKIRSWYLFSDYGLMVSPAPIKSSPFCVAASTFSLRKPSHRGSQWLTLLRLCLGLGKGGV
ncbi:hypothetical protein PanWU01x14_217310 [Parasponia andersonii]|uniref:DNA-directed primase/polymerase protein n=1 Tax=Parasponia andersonii TaxID=3476 RepID=A0A2P5BR43_PARAD|nr:hypothetical protein PanWU01x14_217310 [Parasponia andersonii]